MRDNGVTARGLGYGATLVALLVLGVVDLVQDHHTVPATAMALSLARVVPLLGYRRVPLLAALGELSAVLVTAVVTAPSPVFEFPGSVYIPWPWIMTNTCAVAILAGLIASRGGQRLSLMMATAYVTVGLLLTVWAGHGAWTSMTSAAVVVGVAVFVGNYVHGRGAIAVELVRERKVSAQERELRSVVEERGRIARELHDVVAHHLSMITVQAETVRYRHSGVPDTLATEFSGIADLARSSLAELRGLLSALRDDGADPHRAPQPTLADLPALADRVTAAGTPVALSVPPDVSGLPQVVGLAAYRIVQEALSNVVRHAGGANTRAVVTRTADALEVEVTNDRPPRPAAGAEGTGHGLVGLRERAILLGGTFATDQPDGGWRVRATLPLR